MKTLFLVIGKTIDKHLVALIDDYVQRVKHYQPFELEVIPELKNTKALTPEQQKEREAELLKKSLTSSIILKVKKKKKNLIFQ